MTKFVEIKVIPLVDEGEGEPVSIHINPLHVKAIEDHGENAIIIIEEAKHAYRAAYDARTVRAMLEQR